MQLSKEQRFGIVASTLFLIVFVGMLMIFGFTAPFPPPQEEGILINFGNQQSGSGRIEPKQVEQSVEKQETPPPAEVPEKTEPTEVVEETLTQDYEDAAAIEAEKKRKQQEAEEIERKKQEEAELERKRQEELEAQRIREEQIRKEQEMQEAANNRAKNAFGKNPAGDKTGEGDTKGLGNQGDPKGDINSKNRIGGPGGGNGVSFSLSGRNSRSLPKPAYTAQDQGKVVVEVRVDQNGNVTSADPGKKGTTTSNKQLWQSAKSAALKAKFDVNKNAPATQIGTITYVFSLQ